MKMSDIGDIATKIIPFGGLLAKTRDCESKSSLDTNLNFTRGIEKFCEEMQSIYPSCSENSCYAI